MEKKKVSELKVNICLWIITVLLALITGSIFALLAWLSVNI